MTDVVTEAGIQCMYTDCVDMCPVDAFHEGPNFLAIEPAECIDCGVCVPEWPVVAILEEGDLSPNQVPFLTLDTDLSKKWRCLVARKKALPDADAWADVESKHHLLQRTSKEVLETP